MTSESNAITLAQSAFEAVCKEQVTVITVEDEAAGEFLRLQQHHVEDKGTIFIDPSEWPVLRKTLDEAFASLKK